jgi:O-antigen/teichoic acid export membrane protein
VSLSLLRQLARLKKSLFVRNTLFVMTGTVLAQMIGMAISPLISRLFSPSDFGIFGSFSAISGIITSGVTLEYDKAIMLPEEKEKAINIMALSFLSTLMIGFLCLVVSVAAPSAINKAMKTNGVWALALLVVTVIVTGIRQTCQAWSVRVKAFKHTSASQVIGSISQNSIRVGTGYLHGGSAWLIISAILGNIFATINLVKVVLSDIPSLRGSVRWSQISRLAKDYRDFPIYSASKDVINAISTGLPVLVLSRYFGIAVAGAFAFGGSIITAPMGFVLTALRQVLFQKACESEQQGSSLARLYIRTTVGLFAIVLFPSLALVIWAPQLFGWIFGAKWYMAGEFARSLVIWLAVAFCNLPAVLFARIIRVQRFAFFYDLILLIMRSVALVLGGLFLTALQTITVYAIVGAAMNMFLIFWVGRIVVRKEGLISMAKIRDFFEDERP